MEWIGIKAVPYLVMTAVCLILMVWSFLRSEKYKEWYRNLCLDYKKNLETLMSVRESNALAVHHAKVLKEEYNVCLNTLVITKEELKTTVSQKKSSEVRLGKDAEVLTPFLDIFPYDPKYTKFIGDPLDFVIFDPDKEIVFVEVKSGNSKLSPKQHKLKKLIEDGKVKFDLIRIKA